MTDNCKCTSATYGETPKTKNLIQSLKTITDPEFINIL